MNYAVSKVVNGNFTIASEHGDNLQQARNSYWDQCKALNAEPTVIKATVAIIDENQDVVEGKKEYISHTVENTEE